MRKFLLPASLSLLIALVLAAQLASLSQPSSDSRQTLRESLRQRFSQRQSEFTTSVNRCQLAGLDVAVWEPKPEAQPAPLVIFSHGFRGMNTQSAFIMKALADGGYLVVAPNHKDAMGFTTKTVAPEENFAKAAEWTDKTYLDRMNDVKAVLSALKQDPKWSKKIDWTKIALAGHSLGGYTALALGGAWSNRKLPEVGAVLALSPYCEPFVSHGSLGTMNVPVMYQTGTADIGIVGSVNREGGAFARTSSPTYLVIFEKAGHLAWTGLSRDEQIRSSISAYCVSFLDKYLRKEKPGTSTLDEKLPGVAKLEFH
jgi:dienelactone hydrolase